MPESRPRQAHIDSTFVLVWIGFVLGGTALAVVGLPEDVALSRRVVAGLIIGAFSALILTTTRVLGAYGKEQD